VRTVGTFSAGSETGQSGHRHPPRAPADLVQRPGEARRFHRLAELQCGRPGGDSCRRFGAHGSADRFPDGVELGGQRPELPPLLEIEPAEEQRLDHVPRLGALNESCEDLHLDLDGAVHRDRQTPLEAVEDRQRCRVMATGRHQRARTHSAEQASERPCLPRRSVGPIPRLPGVRGGPEPALGRRHLVAQCHDLVRDARCQRLRGRQALALEQDRQCRRHAHQAR
jgi:hypothetical protein